MKFFWRNGFFFLEGVEKGHEKFADLLTANDIKTSEAYVDGTLSFEDIHRLVYEAVRAKWPPSSSDMPSAYISELFSEFVVICISGKHYRLPYTIKDGKVELGSDADMTEVRSVWQQVAEGVSEEVVSSSILRDLDVSEGLNIIGLAEGSNNHRHWNAVIIKAGLTSSPNLNLATVGLSGMAKKDYTTAALEAAVSEGLFEGAVAIVRSVDDHMAHTGGSEKRITGWFDRTKFVKLAEGGHAVIGRFNLRENRVGREMRERMKNALNGQGTFPEFSITANANIAIVKQANEYIARVTKLAEVHSVDPVHAGNAGGRVLSLSESQIEQHFKERDMKDRLIALIRKHKPALLAGVNIDNVTEDELEGKLAEALATPAATPVANADLAEMKRIKEEIARDRCTSILDRQLSESKLPEAVQKKVRKQFTEKVTVDNVEVTRTKMFTETELSETIASEKDVLAQLNPAHPGTGEGGSHAEVGVSEAERIFSALVGLFESKDAEVQIGDRKVKAKRFTSIRKAYIDITGDENFSGVPRGRRLAQLAESFVAMNVVPSAFVPVAESLNSGSFTAVLASVLHRQMVQEYNFAPYDFWRPLVNVVPLNDFRTQHRVRFGGYGDLPTVGEGDPYTALVSPSDEEATYAPAKRGGTEDVTLEMIANDDVGSIQKIPVRLGRAAKRTLCNFVMNFLRSGFGTTIYDGVNLFDAGGHSNYVTTAFSLTAVQTGYQAMMQQPEFGVAGSLLGIPPRYLIVPTGLLIAASQLLESEKTTEGTTVLSNNRNFLMGKLDLIVDVLASDQTNWFLASDPKDIPGIEIGFFNGEEEPTLFVQDMPNVGSMFNNDKLTWKIRHIYGGTVQDYRGLYGAQVAG